MLRPPRRIFPTRAGIFAMSAPFVLGVAAINASNNLLFLLLGASLGAIALSGIMSERNLKRVRARIAPLGDVRAGEPARMVVTVDRPGDPREVPAFAIRVRERVKRKERAEKLDVSLPIVDGVGTVIGRRTFVRRGRASLEPIEVLTTYPFALVLKAKDVDAGCSVVVRPRPVEVPASLACPRGAAQGSLSAAVRGFGEDVYGLREREARDPFHRIHALRSLGLGREVVVETEAMRRPTAWLGVANLASADGEAFERAIEIAAATLTAWEGEGYAVGLRTAGESFEPGSSTLDEILDALALLERDPASAIHGDPDAFWLVPHGAPPPEGAPFAIVRPDGCVEEIAASEAA